MSLRSALYARFMPWFRGRRFRTFARRLGVSDSDRILDVGGYPSAWEGAGIGARITCLNVDLRDADDGRFTCVRGDGCRLPFPDGAFGVAFSNSVIEHVGAWEDQQRFAGEIRRVAPRIWVQTPNRWFPIEPHFVALFIHFLPRRIQCILARWATPWGWENRPTAEQARAFVDGIRLLTLAEMRTLFPDCEILRERWMGMTKSFIAVRGGGVRRSPEAERTTDLH